MLGAALGSPHGGRSHWSIVWSQWLLGFGNAELQDVGRGPLGAAASGSGLMLRKNKGNGQYLLLRTLE